MAGEAIWQHCQAQMSKNQKTSDRAPPPAAAVAIPAVVACLASQACSAIALGALVTSYYVLREATETIVKAVPKSKGGQTCRCTLRYAPADLTATCPPRVFGTGWPIGICQRNAKMTAPEPCRRYYGHCGYLQ